VPRSEIDLGSWRFWRRDDEFRDGAFATLRREEPVSFHRPLTAEGVDTGAGHWAVTRHADVHHVSRHPELFSSSPNITIGDQTPELAEYFGSMIAMDDPRHARLRNIVRSAFIPRGAGPGRGSGARARAAPWSRTCSPNIRTATRIWCPPWPDRFRCR
jgi:cytochrome P450